MPDLKPVLPLGNLCVHSITQLLAEVIGNTYNSREKQDHLKSTPAVLLRPKVNLAGGTLEFADKKEEIPKPQDNEEDAQQDAPVKEDDHTPSQSSQSEPQSETVEMTVTDENYNRDAVRQKGLDMLRHELSTLLTSHSHVTLHDLLFSSVIARLEPIYLSQKKTHHAIQDIIAHFLNSSLRDLDFGRSKMFSEADMCAVMFDHLHNCTRLEKLIVGRSCYWRSKVFENLSTKLVSLPNLEVLRIEYICTPEIIQGLSTSCPLLCGLSVKGSEKITDAECEEIAKCTGLKSLDISGTRVTGRGCWKILESVKDLHWLQHCAFNCNSDSLLFESRQDLFNCIKKQILHDNTAIDIIEPPKVTLRDITFNLKNFWLFNPLTEDLMTSLLCPHLQQLRLDFVFQDLHMEPEVATLSLLSQLRMFHLNMYDRCSVDLASSMLEACGEQLTDLDLHLADDWFFFAQVQNVVATTCPNLVCASFSGDYKARHSLEDCDDRLDFSIPTPAHPKLERLRITGVVSDCRLRFILSHTPVLRTLHLDGDLEWLHDETFSTVLDSNPLHELEEVWFNVSTTVTLSTARLLLSSDNSLRIMGRLCHMGAASKETYQELLSEIQQKNLDVKLIWVTDQRPK